MLRRSSGRAKFSGADGGDGDRPLPGAGQRQRVPVHANLMHRLADPDDVGVGAERLLGRRQCLRVAHGWMLAPWDIGVKVTAGKVDSEVRASYRVPMGTACVQLIGASPHALKYIFGFNGDNKSTERTAVQILEDNGSGRGDAAAGPLRALLANTADWSKFTPLFDGVIPLPPDPCPPVPPPLSPEDVRLAMAISTYFTATLIAKAFVHIMFETGPNRLIFFADAQLAADQQVEGIVEIRFNHSQVY